MPPPQRSVRIQILFLLTLFCWACTPALGLAQESNAIKNGSMEEETDGFPNHWSFANALLEKGFAFRLDTQNPFEGDQSALVDAADSPGGRSFGNVSQVIDPTPLRGKRVRFRAAVRTTNTQSEGRAQLWLRVDRESKDNQRKMGAFDNMGDRPIKSNEWKHYDIVVDIDEDAQRLTLGMLVFGNAKAWMDDASLIVVDDVDDTQIPHFLSDCSRSQT